MFEVGFDKVAQAIGRDAAACRRLAIDAGRITAIDVTRNPNQLGHLQRAAPQAE